MNILHATALPSTFEGVHPDDLSGTPIHIEVSEWPGGYRSYVTFVHHGEVRILCDHVGNVDTVAQFEAAVHKFNRDRDREWAMLAAAVRERLLADLEVLYDRAAHNANLAIEAAVIVRTLDPEEGE